LSIPATLKSELNEDGLIEPLWLLQEFVVVVFVKSLMPRLQIVKSSYPDLDDLAI